MKTSEEFETIKSEKFEPINGYTPYELANMFCLQRVSDGRVFIPPLDNPSFLYRQWLLWNMMRENENK